MWLPLANFDPCAKLAASIMHKIMIVSPDPDTRRMLELAFDLNGFAASTAMDIPKSGIDVDLLLLDLIKEEKKTKPTLSRISDTRNRVKGSKLVLLLPRGRGAEEPAKWQENADMVVKKPYELLGLVDCVKALAEQGNTTVSIPKKSSSSRRNLHRQSSDPRKRP